MSLNNKGFSFFELVLAIVLLSVGLFGGMVVFENASLKHTSNDTRVIGSKLATEKLEQILADKTFKGYSYIIAANYPNETLTGGYAGYSRSTTITEVAASDLTTTSAGSGYKRVDVTTTWGTISSDNLTISSVVTSY